MKGGGCKGHEQYTQLATIERDGIVMGGGVRVKGHDGVMPGGGAGRRGRPIDPQVKHTASRVRTPVEFSLITTDRPTRRR